MDTPKGHTCAVDRGTTKGSLHCPEHSELNLKNVVVPLKTKNTKLKPELLISCARRARVT